ncbi:MAG TPA: hypothetical protein VGH54_22130 [Mycobacterium sp.]|jgi:hypothetical protein|uniref:hypothetical protein n=1 Tax=Mycobacterium sp. TaxID=1785 RepID=UPI002F3E336A
MKRTIAALALVVAASAASLGLSGTAFAATAADCTNAMALSATAQVNYTNALNVVVARAKELGFTAANISTAEGILAQGNITAAQQASLMQLYSEHASMLSLVSDLPKIKAVLDTRLTLNAAIAAQGIACAGMTVPAPAVVTPAPAPLVLTPAMPVTPACPTASMTVPAVPCLAPATGNGDNGR